MIINIVNETSGDLHFSALLNSFMLAFAHQALGSLHNEKFAFEKSPLAFLFLDIATKEIKLRITDMYAGDICYFTMETLFPGPVDNSSFVNGFFERLLRFIDSDFFLKQEVRAKFYIHYKKGSLNTFFPLTCVKYLQNFSFKGVEFIVDSTDLF